MLRERDAAAFSGMKRLALRSLRSLRALRSSPLSPLSPRSPRARPRLSSRSLRSLRYPTNTSSLVRRNGGEHLQRVPPEEVEPLGALERPTRRSRGAPPRPLERREPARDVHERPEPRRGAAGSPRRRARTRTRSPSTLRRPSTSTVSFLPPAAGVAPPSPLSDPRLDFHPSDPSASRRATPRSTPRASARPGPARRVHDDRVRAGAPPRRRRPRRRATERDARQTRPLGAMLERVPQARRDRTSPAPPPRSPRT